MSQPEAYIPKHTPNFVNPPSRAHEAISAALVSLIFATIAVILRLVTKFKVTHSQGWDDGSNASSKVWALLMNYKYARFLLYASALPDLALLLNVGILPRLVL